MKRATWLIAVAAVAMASGAVGAPEQAAGPGPELKLQGRTLSAELQAKLDAVTATREALLNELQALLNANAEATAEERAALVEQWREDNAEALADVRDSMQTVRQEIREWWMENRPEGAKVGDGTGDPAVLGAVEGEAYMHQVREQREAREQARLALKEQIANAASETQRKEIVATQREARLAEVQQAREEIQFRRNKTDRDASVAAVRDRLEATADTLRTQLRSQDREEAVVRLRTGDQDQATVRDSVRIQDRDRVSQ